MSRPRRQQRHQHGAYANRDRGRKPSRAHPSGGVPWPRLSGGVEWREGLDRVTHVERPEDAGTLTTVEWHDGEWWAVVEWDAWGPHEALTARHPLRHLAPLET